MATDKELVTVREASDILNYAISLPNKKCITFGELTQIIDEMPKGNGVINENYNDVENALISSSTSYNFCLVQNLNNDEAKIMSGYGSITLTFGQLGGYYCIPNASGNQSVTIAKNTTTVPAFYRYAPTSNGGFTRKDFKASYDMGSYEGYSHSWKVDFNQNYDMNGYGYFFFVVY